MAIVLGLCFGHDGAVALVKDGRLVCAVAKERLTRRKKAGGIGRALIDYVLDEAGVGFADIDLVACAGYQSYTGRGHIDEPHCLEVCFGDAADPASLRPVGTGIPTAVPVSLHVRGIETHDTLAAVLDGQAKPLALVHHHLSHCAAAFFTSPFDRAACLSVDASSAVPESCSLTALGHGRTLEPLACPGVMIGNTYNNFTGRLGLGPGLIKAGTTMGLASYGTVSDAARAALDDARLSFWDRAIRDEAEAQEALWTALSGLPAGQGLSREDSDSRRAMDIAASLQFLFQEVMVDTVRRLADRAGPAAGGNLCLAGGSLLNCDANTHIQRRGGFERVHLFPGCGDDGTAVGAALYAAHVLLGEPRARYGAADIVYLGRAYPVPPLGQSLVQPLGQPLDVTAVARCLAGGGIVALAQGRGEFGPRALGNRSILADPRHADMRDILNGRIKKREWFRPFAPAVLAGQASQWFRLDAESPFMLFLAEVLQPDIIPAVTHVDGSARPQTVRREDNPLFYDIISAFAGLTGVPVLLNTSLNVDGEPLVETPEDAQRFLRATGVDLLVLGDRMLTPKDLP